MKMKRLLNLLLVGLLVALTSNQVMAQEEETEITDEELRRYAVTMDSVERMKKNIVSWMTIQVEENEEITGARFNELSAVIGDSIKLAEANATAEEIAFINMIKEEKDKMTADINTTFKTMAIDYIGEGGRTYNKIKKALRSNSDVKARYDAILVEVEKENGKTEEVEVEIEEDSK